MSQALQPVIDAVKRGDKPKAIELIKQIQSINPNDIEALLVLAAILDEPTRKRQVLNRVLSLAPGNKKPHLINSIEMSKNLFPGL